MLGLHAYLAWAPHQPGAESSASLACVPGIGPPASLFYVHYRCTSLVQEPLQGCFALTHQPVAEHNKAVPCRAPGSCAFIASLGRGARKFSTVMSARCKSGCRDHTSMALVRAPGWYHGRQHPPFAQCWLSMWNHQCTRPFPHIELRIFQAQARLARPLHKLPWEGSSFQLLRGQEKVLSPSVRRCCNRSTGVPQHRTQIAHCA